MSSPSASRSPADVSPDELLAGFSTSNVFRWFLVALLVHAVVIGGFSIGTIRDALDPEGAKARKEAALAAAKAAATPAATTAPAAQPAAATPAAAPEATAAAKPEAPQTPIEKVPTEAAKPDEIPDTPDDLGLSIEDTNVK
jgi:outer membrane biosynthesis protein TonB